MGENSARSPGKNPSASASQMLELVLPHHINTMNKLFGGQLMQWIDIAASIAAKRHCNRPVLTASMDRLDFLNPADMGDLIELNSMVNRAFNTSMEVGVKVFAENLHTGVRTHIASAYLTIVALGDDGKPCKVSPIEPLKEEEFRRYREAEHRRRSRMIRI